MNLNATNSNRVLSLIAIAAILVCPAVYPFDGELSQFLRQPDLPGDLRKAIELSEAFAHGFGVFFILMSVFVVSVSRRKQVLVAILITLSSGLLANGMKAAFVRVRPHAEGLVVASSNSAAPPKAEVVEASFWDARQRSFPSGHSATAWGLAIGLALLFPRGIWIFISLALLASAQRIVSGAHYPSDVVAGIAIAFLCAAVILSSKRVRVMMQA
jgi:membrane-associated phospholipid phosphatase